MIIVYLSSDVNTSHKINEKNSQLLKKALWVDLFHPTKKEELLIQKTLQIDVPKRKEMEEIEPSSRIYKANNALFMTAIMIAQADSKDPRLEPVSFILTPQQLITVRYFEPPAFKLFSSQLDKFNLSHDSSMMFIGLIEAAIDGLADNLELVGARLDKLSQEIFRQEQTRKKNKKVNYKHIMQSIGLNADLVTEARESLMTFSRVVGFFLQSAEPKLQEEERLRSRTVSTDIQALSDYATFISNKVTFLLEATLGMIGIEQSSIIKIFSVAAVIFLPPTLIASIYGMNFKFMPELSYKWGYLIAIGFMVLSAFIPYKFFKYKKWL